MDEYSSVNNHGGLYDGWTNIMINSNEKWMFDQWIHEHEHQTVNKWTCIMKSHEWIIEKWMNIML